MAEALCGEPHLGAAKARVITGLVLCRAPGRELGVAERKDDCTVHRAGVFSPRCWTQVADRWAREELAS